MPAKYAPSSSRRASPLEKVHLRIWEEEYSKNPKPSLVDREDIARRSGKTVSQVTKWFEKRPKRDLAVRSTKATRSKFMQSQEAPAMEDGVDLEERILFSQISHVLGKLDVLYAHNPTASRAKAAGWADALEISGPSYPKDIIHRWLDWKRAQVAGSVQDDEDDGSTLVDDRSRDFLTPISPVHSPPRPIPAVARSPSKSLVSRANSYPTLSTPIAANHPPTSPSFHPTLPPLMIRRSLSDGPPTSSPFVTISDPLTSALSVKVPDVASGYVGGVQYQSFKAFLRARYPSGTSVSSNDANNVPNSTPFWELSRLEAQSRRILDDFQSRTNHQTPASVGTGGL